MKCDFNLHEDGSVKQTLDFLHSIGVGWLKSEDVSGINNVNIDIEFIDAPDILRIYSIESTPSICNISYYGVSFYLVVGDACSSAFKAEYGFNDGLLFCPMSNIKSINTIGQLTSRK